MINNKIIADTLPANLSSSEISILPISSDVSDTEINEIFAFYNAYFQSKHTLDITGAIYRSKTLKPIVMLAKKGNEIVGLVEAWNDIQDKSIKILSTVLVAENHKRKKLGSKLINQILSVIKSDPTLQKVIIHFRESNEYQLSKVYAKFGFTEVIKGHVETYQNGDIKKEMELKLKDIPKIVEKIAIEDVARKNLKWKERLVKLFKIT